VLRISVNIKFQKSIHILKKFFCFQQRQRIS